MKGRAGTPVRSRRIVFEGRGVDQRAVLRERLVEARRRWLALHDRVREAVREVEEGADPERLALSPDLDAHAEFVRKAVVESGEHLGRKLEAPEFLLLPQTVPPTSPGALRLPPGRGRPKAGRRPVYLDTRGFRMECGGLFCNRLRHCLTGYARRPDDFPDDEERLNREAIADGWRRFVCRWFDAGVEELGGRVVRGGPALKHPDFTRFLLDRLGAPPRDLERGEAERLLVEFGGYCAEHGLFEATAPATAKQVRDLAKRLRSS